MKYASLLIAVLLILAACAQPEEKKESEADKLADQLKEQTTEPEVTETIEQPAQQEETPEIIEIPEDATEETTSPAQERTSMYKFLDKFAKVTGYEFKNKANHYYVKGTTYKIILGSAKIEKGVKFGEITKSLFYYDTVYVDRATKTAIAYCEGHTSQINTQCNQLELYDLAYPVTYADYSILLPEDWLLTYLDKEPTLMETNKYYIEGRATVFVKIDDDPDVELSIDPGTGLVLRADRKNGDQILARYEYSKLSANTVRDVDVRHRSRSEIPSEETFYK